ncbi:MAG TPA: SH3 domain-containing protein [Candidatus Eisenbacteria bacterium]|nr:SH3 domain-containing protein [Candidatus Eisenbacteria bacterium]
MRNVTLLRIALALGVLVTLTLVIPQPVSAFPELRPVDEAVRQPDFFSFRAQLQAAIARRDTAAVIAALDPGVRLSFGGHGGLADFRTMWLVPDRLETLWREMGTVLALGGSFQGSSRFVAPYVFSEWPSQGADAFEHVAVIGSNVRVRAEPRQDAPVIARLSYRIVAVGSGAPARGPEAREWVAVRLEDGRKGYMSRAYVRSPVDYRILCSKTPRGWVVDSFVAGD